VGVRSRIILQWRHIAADGGISQQICRIMLLFLASKFGKSDLS
jgi:hypothetical protein